MMREGKMSEEKCTAPPAQVAATPAREETPKAPERPADGKSPLYWLWLVKPWTWPRWAKVVAALLLIPILTFYYRDKRVGDGFWGTAEVREVEAGVKVRVDNYGRTKVTYGDGKELAAEGMQLVVVTKEDHEKDTTRLAPFMSFIKDSDWPLVVFVNSTGFDPTGEPVVIRRASDGQMLYSAGSVGRVALSVPKRDGSFTVHLADGSKLDVSEKDWVEKFMRLKYQSPPDLKELEKMSDDELKARGYLRLPIEEAKQKGLVDGDGKPVPNPPRLMLQDLLKDKNRPPAKDKK
jgi:hypothetical protein